MVLAREEMGQFMAEGRETVARRMEHDAPGAVAGLGQEKGGAVPIFGGIGQISRIALEMDRLLLEGGTDFLSPGFQLRKRARLQQAIIILMASLAPDLFVKDQVAVLHRIDQDAASGAVHGSFVMPSPVTGLPQEVPARQGDLNIKSEKNGLTAVVAKFLGIKYGEEAAGGLTSENIKYSEEP